MARGDRRRRYLALRAELAGDSASPADPRAAEPRVLAALEARLPADALARVPLRVYPLRPGLLAVRVPHTAAVDARAALDGLRTAGFVLRTVTTSGTLRQAKAALGIHTPKRPKHRPPKAARNRPRNRPGPPRTLK